MLILFFASVMLQLVVCILVCAVFARARGCPDGTGPVNNSTACICAGEWVAGFCAKSRNMAICANETGTTKSNCSNCVYYADTQSTCHADTAVLAALICVLVVAGCGVCVFVSYRFRQKPRRKTHTVTYTPLADEDAYDGVRADDVFVVDDSPSMGTSKPVSDSTSMS